MTRYPVLGRRSTHLALGALLLLPLSCALIDPIDPVPSGNGAAPAAIGGSTAGGQASGGIAARGGGGDAGFTAHLGGSIGGSSAGDGIGASAGSLSPSGNGGVTAGQGGASGGTPALPCAESTDCDSSSRCRPDHVCVRLDTRDSTAGVTGPCPKLLGAEFAHDPNAIFFGAFAPLDQSSVEAQTISAIYEMAAGEFNDLGGLRGASTDPPSPLVVIVCNNADASVPEALRHLIEDVQVPAVLAAMDLKQLLFGFNTYRDTFFVSAFNGSQELADVSAGRAWTMLGQPADFADIYAALMPRAEALVHAGLASAGADRELRVAAITELDNAFEKELGDAVLSRVTFNGRNAAEQPSNFLARQVASDGSNVAAIVADVYANLPPDIVLSFASNVFTASTGVMPSLDRKSWPGQRPLYLLSPENAQAGADVNSELRNLRQVDSKDNVGRVLGVSPAGLPAGMTDALNLFRLNLTSVQPTARTDFGNYYDAFYFLVDAMYASPRAALRDGTISALDLGRGMRRLTNLSKPTVNLGRMWISEVFSRLSPANSAIQLFGTLGEPDFDGTTGMRSESGSLYCFDSTRLEFQPDVIRYNRATLQLEQEPHPPCLINFLGP